MSLAPLWMVSCKLPLLQLQSLYKIFGGEVTKQRDAACVVLLVFSVLGDLACADSNIRQHLDEMEGGQKCLDMWMTT